MARLSVVDRGERSARRACCQVGDDFAARGAYLGGYRGQQGTDRWISIFPSFPPPNAIA